MIIKSGIITKNFDHIKLGQEVEVVIFNGKYAINYDDSSHGPVTLLLNKEDKIEEILSLIN
jgi:hypothetical protein